MEERHHCFALERVDLRVAVDAQFNVLGNVTPHKVARSECNDFGEAVLKELVGVRWMSEACCHHRRQSLASHTFPVPVSTCIPSAVQRS